RRALRSVLCQRPEADEAPSPLPPLSAERLEQRTAAPFSKGQPVLWERVRLSNFPGEPDGLVLLTAAPSSGQGQRRPVVLLLHSTGKCKEYVAEHLERWAQKGFLAVAYDARYHGERALPGAGLRELSLQALGPALVDEIVATEQQRLKVYHAALVRAWRTGAESPFVFDTAGDGICVIDYLVSRSDVDAKRIGVVGISLGGMSSWLLAAADERVSVAVPAIGVQSFRYALEQEIWAARVDTIRPVFEAAAKDLGKKEVDTATVEAVWQRIVPGLAVADASQSTAFDAPLTLPCVAPRPMLVISGEKDPRCPLQGVRLALASAEAAYASAGAKGSLRSFVDK
ncbi:unnamed protein product, partial [Polarella glacialis]